jgi:hypothetical protein
MQREHNRVAISPGAGDGSHCVRVAHGLRLEAHLHLPETGRIAPKRMESPQMFRSIRSLVPVLVAIASAWPMAASAQVQQLPQLAPDLQTVEQTRQAFSGAGYTVDQAHAWNWTSPPVSTFQVQDSAGDRVLMVLVYPSLDAAQAARLEAQAHEQALSNSASVNTGAGPHLVVGYGPSTWSANVALVETTGSSLRQMYQTQIDRDTGVSVDSELLQAPSQPEMAVDVDCQAVLLAGVNL